MSTGHDGRGPRLAAALLIATILSACGGGGGSASPPPTNPPPAGTLQVLSTVPALGQFNVYAGTVITATFDRPLDPASVNGANFIVSHLPGGPIAGTASYDAATYAASFAPAQPLAYGAAYAVMLTGIRGAGGETLANNAYGWSFWVQSGPDTTAPTTTASPTGGYYNAPQSVTLSCADNVNGTGCAATHYTLDGSAPTTASPLYTAPIAVSTSTSLRFFSRDFEGNQEAPRREDYVIDTVPPTVAPLSPADGATGVKVNTSISAQFSEMMRPATVNTATVRVDNGVTGTVSYDAATRVVTFIPAQRLECNGVHVVTVTTGAQDLAGNGLAADTSWSFTTSGDCTEPHTTASVAGGVYTAPQSVTLTCTDADSGCYRIVYTTDGSMPSLTPLNGTAVFGSSAGPITVGVGDTALRFFAEDNAGQREVVREVNYSVSTSGFTYAATNGGLGRGVGPQPVRFVNIAAPGDGLALHDDPFARRLYHGTSKGLYFSDDNGANWVRAALSGSVYGVYARGSRIYAATTEGLKISTDGGASFVTRTMSDGLGDNSARAVVVDGRRVYVATNNGVSVSDDKGASFVNRTTAQGLGSNNVRDLALSGATLYAATAAGLALSGDGGATFANRTTANGLGHNSVRKLHVSGANVYAATEGGLSISADGGASFSNRTTAHGLGHNLVTSVFADGGSVYAGTGEYGARVAVSGNGGASFTAYAFADDNSDYKPLSGIYRAGTGRLFATSYFGCKISDDNGASFAYTQLVTDSLRDVRVANGRLYVTLHGASGYNAGLAISTDHGRSFSLRTTAHGLGSRYVNDLHVEGNNVYGATNWGLSISTDAGQGFVNRTRTDGLFDNGIYSTYVSGANVYAGTNNSIDRSTNGGASFATLTTLNSGIAQGIAVAGSNLYVAATNGLWLSTNNGATFSQKTTADGLGGNYLLAVAINGATVYAGTLNYGLYISTNGGQSFNVAAGLTSGNVYSLRLTGGTLYAGSSAGAAFSSDGGQSFAVRTTAAGLGSNIVRDLFYAP